MTDNVFNVFTIHSFIHNLLHYHKAGDQASSVELLDELRFILHRCKESRRRTSCLRTDMD